jgi:hypothetical protein
MKVFPKYHLLAFLLLFALAPNLHAQKYSHKKIVQNLREFDKKKIHFGFNLGVNVGDFRLSSDIGSSDSLLGITVTKQPGFNIGTVADYHILPELNLRFLFTLSFAQRDLQYTFRRGATTTSSQVKPIESTYLDFPLNLKYRSLRYNNFAAYVIGGGLYSLDLASKESTASGEVPVRIKRHTYSYQVGAGFDFFLEYFKFGLELKMSYGIGNINVPDRTIFSEPINDIQSKVFTISFLFEG